MSSAADAYAPRLSSTGAVAAEDHPEWTPTKDSRGLDNFSDEESGSHRGGLAATKSNAQQQLDDDDEEDASQVEPEQLKRALGRRHIVMLAIGGVIGPGLLVGSGNALASAGPVGALIAFAITGLIVYFVMQALGEMAAILPIRGSFVEYAGQWLDPAAGFTAGWIYWELWTAILANEYSAVAIVIQYWEPLRTVTTGGWIAIFWVIFMAFSLLGVLAYAEAEFVLASIKVLGLVVFFILSIVVNVGGTGNLGYIGFRYFRDPGPFVGTGVDALNGIVKIFVISATLYSGSESCALAAAEARNPRKAVPSAIRSVFARILFLYLGTIFFIGLNVPSNDEQLVSAKSKSAASPLTIALQRGGISAAAHVINALIIVSVISAGNSSLYLASRTLQSLGSTGRAPKFFAYTTKRGKVPLPALVFSNLVALISLLSISAGASRTFTYILNVSGVSTFIIWAIICACHVRFRSAWIRQGHTIDQLPFKAWLYPYGTYFALILNIILAFVQGYTTFLSPRKAADIIVAYIVLPVAAMLYFGWKIYHRTRIPTLDEIDLDSGRRSLKHLEEVERIEEEEEEEKRRQAEALGGGVAGWSRRAKNWAGRLLT